MQLWDFRMGTLIDRFDEHDGPVRGVCFHRTQPLFVSGGDDYKIKLWSFKLRRCLFTLLGHLDYIRTVQFHQEYPWVVSASDDQTIRVWNWQSRTCISALTGHHHCVTRAAFHAKEDLVVSASLDQTVRVWDIAGLRKKTVAPAEDVLRIPQMNTDLFGGGDAVVKYVLEGHDRGVNWAAFHPSLPLIVSGADDRQVKLWRMNDTKAWEVDTLRGHVNNVSCVMFHARQDVIVSNSEDRSIRVWDMSKRTGVQTFRREHDRFWILAAHPEVNLLAAGHDSGMIVFKLERERPAFATHGNQLYYVRDRYLRIYDFETKRDNPILSIRRSGGSGGGSSAPPRGMTYNPAENAILLSSDAEGGSYELFQLPRDAVASVSGKGTVTSAATVDAMSTDSRRGLGASAVFVARNRFAVFDRSSGQIFIKNLRNEVTKKVAPPCPSTDAIFYAGTGNLLCRAEDKVVLFDVQQRKTLAEMSTSNVKYVVWSTDMNYVALLSKHAIHVGDKRLRHLCTVHETIRVKSGAWDPSGVFVYTTLNHIKYCLPNGDSGIVRTLDQPVYVTRVNKGVLCCLDRQGKNVEMEIDASEYLFKLALHRREYDRVLAMIRSDRLCGQSIISYLQQKGFPEVALHFVRDDRTRFSLAIECGNIEVALQAAHELDERDLWHKLGIEALRQGNHHIVEFAYQRTKNFERLSFLYLITGNLEKLQKMLKIAEMRSDVTGRFHNALYLGDVQERVRVLEESGQLPLAYATAKTHGIEEDATRIAEKLTESIGEDVNLKAMLLADGGLEAKLMLPPKPLVRCDDNWPLLTVSKGFFEGNLAAAEAMSGGKGAFDMPDADMADAAAGAWGGDDLDLGGDMDGIGGDDDGMDGIGGGDDDEDGGWEMEDLDLPPDVGGGAMGGGEGALGVGADGFFAAPSPGVAPCQRWSQKCGLAGEQAAAGAFDSAMRLLTRQLGIVDFSPLQEHMVNLACASHASLPGMPQCPGFVTAMERGWTAETPSPVAHEKPILIFSLPALEDSLKAAYKCMTEGKFPDAQKTFTTILTRIPLIVVDSRREVDEVKELVTICREYLVGLACEMKRKDTPKEDLKAQLELAAFFANCQMQPIHGSLAIRNAMVLFFKAKQFNMAAAFCRRLLELNPSPKVAQQARQVLQACERTPGDALEIDFDPRNPFDIDVINFKPIYRGGKYSECPYTGARFSPDCEGQVCPIGGMTKIGVDASGLVCSPTQIR